MAISKWGAGIIDRLRPAVWMGFFVVAILIAQVMTAPSAMAASLDVTPASGPPGSTVAVRGEGFVPLAQVRLCWDGDRCTNLGQAQAGLTGQMSIDITVPGDAAGGGHSIHACQQLAVEWSCDSIGFEVIVPTTTTTSTTTTTTVPTTTTTRPPTTTTTQAPRTTTTSPPATTSPTGGGAPPTTGTAPSEATTPSTTSSLNSGSTTTTNGPDTTTTNGPDTTTTTTTEGDSFGILPSYRPPSGPESPGTENPDVEATILGASEEEQATVKGGNEWMIAIVAVAVVAATLWVANNLIKGDRRRYILDLARHRSG